MMVVINDTFGVVGGSITLIIHMCEWFKKNNVDVCVIYDRSGNEEIKKNLINMEIPIYNVGIFSIRNRINVMHMLQERYNDICVINLNWNLYFDMEIVKSKFKRKFSNIMYVIHPDGLKKGMNLRVEFLRRLYINIHKKILLKMNNDKALVFMDEEYKETTEMFYNCKIPSMLEIIRIPVPIIESNDAEKIINDGFYSNIILSASRAEFPFKLYLLGLINNFKKIKEINKNIKLYIISDGPDIDIMKKKIDEMPLPLKKDIILEGWCKYEELLEKMKKAKIYIGMGTTLLEAGKNYKIAIAAQHDSDDFRAEGFTYDFPNLLMSSPKCEKDALEFIRIGFNMNYDEYKDACYKTFDSVKNLYGFQTVMPKFLKLNGGRRNSMNYIQIFFYSLYRRMRTANNKGGSV